VVLTGGGAQLDGLLEMAEQIFDASVRYGVPQGLGGLVDVISSPAWSCASGLLLYGRAAEQSEGRNRKRAGFSVRGVMGNLRGMFQDLL
jgi:cell division protein FtsA